MKARIEGFKVNFHYNSWKKWFLNKSSFGGLIEIFTFKMMKKGSFRNLSNMYLESHILTPNRAARIYKSSN